MITAQDITSILDTQLLKTDTRFIVGQEHDGYVDVELDDALIRVALNQLVTRKFTVPEREVSLGRRAIFDKYAAPVIAEFIAEFRSKAKGVIVSVAPIIRRDPNRITQQGGEASLRLAASSLITQKGDVEFLIEMKFGTFRV